MADRRRERSYLNFCPAFVVELGESSSLIMNGRASELAIKLRKSTVSSGTVQRSILTVFSRSTGKVRIEAARGQPMTVTMGTIGTNMSVVLLLLCCCTQIFIRTTIAQNSTNYNYQDIYETQWSGDHVILLNNGTQVQLYLDTRSGAGFQSKSYYTYGHFSINAKLVSNYSAGVVAAFYVSSSGPTHDELDFEFLGTVDGQKILQTNMFANGTGGREQKFSLWFDPTADFHTYQVIWNHAQIIWLVDQMPIRVFKNLESIGQAYPGLQQAQAFGTIFDGSGWATQDPSGAPIPVNYTYAPFVVTFNSFQLDACVNDGVTVPQCSSNYQNNWWEGPAYTNLTSNQISTLTYITQAYSTYNYCKDPARYTPPPIECSYNYNG